MVERVQQMGEMEENVQEMGDGMKVHTSFHRDWCKRDGVHGTQSQLTVSGLSKRVNYHNPQRVVRGNLVS